jgi:hypothetical protein
MQFCSCSHCFIRLIASISGSCPFYMKVRLFMLASVEGCAVSSTFFGVSTFCFYLVKLSEIIYPSIERSVRPDFQMPSLSSAATVLLGILLPMKSPLSCLGREHDTIQRRASLQLHVQAIRVTWTGNCPTVDARYPGALQLLRHPSQRPTLNLIIGTGERAVHGGPLRATSLCCHGWFLWHTILVLMGVRRIVPGGMPMKWKSRVVSAARRIPAGRPK